MIARAINRVLARVFGTTPDGDRRVWLHWQNLMEDKGRPDARPWHGRAWLNDWRAKHRTLGVEWTFGPYARSCHVGISFDGSESEVMLRLAVPLLFSLYLSLDGWRRPIRLWKALGYDDREFRLSAHDYALWWNVWHSDMEWKRGTPRWRHGSFHPIDFFLGRQKHSSRIISTTNVLIPMPEGSYPAVVTLDESTWKRPRWPFAFRRKGAKIDVERGVEFEGKGENSWDCGKDAIYGLSCSATTVDEAIGAFVEAALKNRRRYGYHGPGPVMAPAVEANA